MQRGAQIIERPKEVSMIKQFCDACGREITEKDNFVFSYLHYIEELLINGNILNNIKPDFCEKRSYDLCIICYERIFLSSVSKFIQIKEKHENSLLEE